MCEKRFHHISQTLTPLAGIGGMSEWSMMTGAQCRRIAYPAFLLAMVVMDDANYYLPGGWRSRYGWNPATSPE